MAVDINGTTLSLASNILSVKSGGATTQLTYNAAGNILKSTAHPMYRAYGSYSGWVAGTQGAWNTIIYDTAPQNQNSCYNTTTGIFTAPVAGVYLFQNNTYSYTPGGGAYMHPMYWVNGASGTNRPNGNAVYRIRGHGTTAGYSFDGDCCEFIKLAANDYVEYKQYFAVSINWYPAYSQAAAWLLG